MWACSPWLVKRVLEPCVAAKNKSVRPVGQSKQSKYGIENNWKFIKEMRGKKRKKNKDQIWKKNDWKIKLENKTKTYKRTKDKKKIKKNKDWYSNIPNKGDHFEILIARHDCQGRKERKKKTTLTKIHAEILNTSHQ
jgi:hypothetical protein